MKKFILSVLLAAAATTAHADDYWSGNLDINTFFQRDNYYDGNGVRMVEQDQAHRTATAEVQYRWNACAVGAHLNLTAASYKVTYLPFGLESELDADGYGAGAQAGCNLHGLWLVGFGGVQKTNWESISPFSEITDYRERTIGAGLYFQQMERLGYGIAVSRLNTQYTVIYNPFLGYSLPFEYEFDTNIIEGKVDFFITPNLLSSTTISYAGEDSIGTGTLFTRLEFKPENMNFAAYAGIGGSITTAEGTDEEIKSYSAKVGLRWYFANDTLQAMHNNQMPTFD